jgi:hypothetical protein
MVLTAGTRLGPYEILAPDGYLMSVAVDGAGEAFHTGARQRLFKLPAPNYNWDVSADGKRFLIVAPQASALASPPIPRGGELDWITKAVSVAVRRRCTKLPMMKSIARSLNFWSFGEVCSCS